MQKQAVAFFVCLVTALLEKPLREQLVVLGEMSVPGLLLKVSNLTNVCNWPWNPVQSTCWCPSENKRDLADVPDEILNKLQAIFYTDPTNAAVERGTRLAERVNDFETPESIN